MIIGQNPNGTSIFHSVSDADLLDTLILINLGIL